MRTFIGIAAAILAFKAVAHPMLSQATNTPALEAIYMIDSLTGWAVTSEPRQPIWEPHTLLRTVDGGIHWTDVTPPTYQSGFFGSGAGPVEILTSLFAWLGSLRTVDGGRRWSDIRFGNIMSIHFINARDGWLMNFGGSNMSNVENAVHRSADGGETWTKIASSRKYVGDLSACAGDKITFLNATTGWITSRAAVFQPREWLPLCQTVNGGRFWKWQKLPLPPQLRRPWRSEINRPKFFTASDGLLPVFYTNMRPNTPTELFQSSESFVVLYATHDGGATWMYTSPLSVKFQRCSYNCLYVFDSPFNIAGGSVSLADMNHGWVWDGDTLFATTNSGREWIQIRPASFTGAKQIDFVSPRVGWAVTVSSPFLLKTADGGITWVPLPFTISR